ncbi:MAG: hypothetical protein RLZZ171_2606 [Cyanobacteriota bacterium]|jgi:hypothetical protein
MKIVEQKGKYITTREADSLLFKEFRRPLIEIMTDLRKPIAPRFIKTKLIKGKSIEFVSWYQLNRLMDFYAPGWEWSLNTSFDGSRVCVVGSLTIKAKEGDFSRSATGNENSDLEVYGDPYSNAEAQAFRRACARWGLGLHLWG